MTVLVLFIIVIIPTVAQYCQSRDHTSMPENGWDCNEQNKTNQKEAKTNKKRDVNWWPEKCLCTVNQELISYTYPQGNEDGLVWCSRICAKSQRERHSATTKKGKNGKEKEDSGIGNSSKEAVVSSWVHTALCALREQLYECLCDAALQQPLHGQGQLSPHGAAPHLCSHPELASFSKHFSEAKPPKGSQRGGIPHPISCIPPGHGVGRTGEDLVDPN